MDERGFPKRITADLPIVRVHNGNVGAAINQLNRRLTLGGDGRLLKWRAQHPKRSERRKAKAARAASRRRRSEQRRAGWR